MVDLDKVKDKFTGGDEDDSGSSSSASSSGSSSSSGGAEAFELKEEAQADPSGGQISEVSEEWASDHSELNFDNGDGGSLEHYMSVQIEECEELFDNMIEISTDHMDSVEEFTLYFHAMTLNMSQNRLGVFNTIKDNFDKSDRQAAQITEEIMNRAGEPEALQEIFEELMYSMGE